jgi:hypothetical protein
MIVVPNNASPIRTSQAQLLVSAVLSFKRLASAAHTAIVGGGHKTGGHVPPMLVDRHFLATAPTVRSSTVRPSTVRSSTLRSADRHFQAIYHRGLGRTHQQIGAGNTGDCTIDCTIAAERRRQHRRQVPVIHSTHQVLHLGRDVLCRRRMGCLHHKVNGQGRETIHGRWRVTGASPVLLDQRIGPTRYVRHVVCAVRFTNTRRWDRWTYFA